MTPSPVTRDEDGSAPLHDVLVADFSVTLPGPYCSQLLRRLGARVIHLEPPGGDPVRAFPDVFASLAEGKESVVIDLVDDGDRALALAITDAASVVIEGWRPGVADRLGIGPRTVMGRNPRVVYCSISGYGHDGQLESRAGHDINYVAEAGALGMVSDSGLPVADLSGAMFAALRISASLRHAERTGDGQYLDVSLTGAVRDWVEAIGGHRTGVALPQVYGLPHYGAFETLDGELLTLGVVFEEPLWRDSAAALGRPEWAEIVVEDRARRANALRSEIAFIISSATAVEWENRLAAVDTCWALARRPDHSIRTAGGLQRTEGSVPTRDEHRSQLLRFVDDSQRKVSQ